MIRFLRAAAFLLLCAACSETPPSLPDVRTDLIRGHLLAQTELVPRHSGTAGARLCADRIVDRARSAGADTVSVEKFEDMTPVGKMEFRNIHAELRGKSSDFILLAAHYDAKYLEYAPAFPAANDGASGVAALLEIIRCFSAVRPEMTLRFVFFDGEEARFAYTAHDGLHGSRHLAEKWASDGTLKHCRAMILLDMIGDKSLKLSVAENNHPELVRLLRAEAARMNPPVPLTDWPGTILDDHEPFRKHGVPAIDLIDFEYGPGNLYWHTSEDVPERVSPENIARTAELAMRLVRRLDRRTGKL